jgi:hypothetical protein
MLRIENWNSHNNFVYGFLNGLRIKIMIDKNLILAWQHFNQNMFEFFCIILNYLAP